MRTRAKTRLCGCLRLFARYRGAPLGCILLFVVSFWPVLAAAPAALSEGDIADWIVAEGGRVERDGSGKITAVDLTSTWITDADLARISRLPHLQKLTLAHTKITDIGLEQLKPLENVTDLNLYYAEYIRDNGLVHLKGWQKLERLNLHGTRITSRALEHLSYVRSLQSLDIGHTEVTDAGFEHLAELTRLRRLDIGGNRLNGSGLTLLKLLPNLKHLDISGIQRVDSGLWGLPLTESTLEKIGELTRLEVLDLSGATITNTGLDRPGRPDAERAELHHLSKLGTLVNLHTLNLSRQPVSSRGLAVLRNFRRLRRLDIGDAPRVDDSIVPILLELEQLEVLFLAGTSVTDEGLRELEPKENLARLYVGDSKVTEAGVARFRQARPDCQVSW